MVDSLNTVTSNEQAELDKLSKLETLIVRVLFQYGLVMDIPTKIQAAKRIGELLNENERRKTPRKDIPTIFEIRACFHRMWTNNVGKEGYKKDDWLEFQRLFYQKFGISL